MPRRRDLGFSLLEIIVALGIFMVGAASVFTLFAAGAGAHKRAIDRANAARAADSIFAELESKWTLAGDLQRGAARREPVPAAPAGKAAKAGKAGKRPGAPDDYPVPAEGKAPWAVPGYPQYRYDVQYTPVDDENDAVMATVFVHWKSRGSDRVETFRRLLLRRPF